MFFSYWTNAARTLDPPTGATPLDTMLADWKSGYENFHVFTDSDVAAILKRWSPTLPDQFSRIRIPACRADLARLILLYEYGGLYVDAHVGTAGAERLAQVLERLSSRELLLFDLCEKHQWDGDHHIVNFVLGGRKGSSALAKVIFGAIQNLQVHEKAEAATSEYVPYNIFVLTGPWHISTILFDRSTRHIHLRPEFEELVHVEALQAHQTPWPVQPYKHYHYRKPGQHWSERQLVERLFEPSHPAFSGEDFGTLPISDVASQDDQRR